MRLAWIVTRAGGGHNGMSAAALPAGPPAIMLTVKERHLNQPGMQSKVAVIVVDHGSRLAEANRMLDAVADNLRAARPGSAVYVAHMELAEPSIESAFRSAVAGGAGQVVVHPYFLSPGKHSQLDIPRMAAQAAAKFPGVSHVVTEPLGLDDLMTRLVWKRIDQSLAQSSMGMHHDRG
ncbi:MAG: hypothetical protein BIFFINMI_01094 [Phycisphaerae bacterium]|nr:hypothetical protein [Phycisphaerae bacterium]